MSLLDFKSNEECAALIGKTYNQDSVKEVIEIPPFNLFYTVFRCKAVPTISLADYFTGLVRRLGASTEALLLSVIYLHRLTSFKNAQNPQLHLNARTVHRLLSTSFLLALKYIDERNIRASDYGKVSGCQLRETLMQERCALHILDYRMQASLEELVAARLFITGKNGSFISALLSVSYYPDKIYLKIMYAINAERDERERAQGIIMEQEGNS